MGEAIGMDYTAVWVTTEPDGNGGYHVTITAGPDQVRYLNRTEALRYASGILQAAHRAAYDAAVTRQLIEVLKTDLEYVVVFLKLLRDMRPPLDPADTHPIRLEPGVSALTGKAFLQIFVAKQEEPVGQWTFADALEHAMAVLGTVEVARLDGDYRQALVDRIEIEPDRAEVVVDDLQRFRAE